MPLYEVMFIVQPDLDDAALEEAISKVKELMQKEKGEITLWKKMGKRRMAYEINDFKEGFYVVANVKAEANIVPELDHFFKVNEGYLRYIVIRSEGGKKEEQAGEKETAENIMESDHVQEEGSREE